MIRENLRHPRISVLIIDGTRMDADRADGRGLVVRSFAGICGGASAERGWTQIGGKVIRGYLRGASAERGWTRIG
ncbi:MAG TPA: hypothetical protein DEF43_14560, partial [Chloroflexus aurantiacus]|uniref:hypothetical protein n=1 Tax=Chloroflexus aurantiacus TaxID=1108 RepID=UPI000E96FA2A